MSAEELPAPPPKPKRRKPRTAHRRGVLALRRAARKRNKPLRAFMAEAARKGDAVAAVWLANKAWA